MLENMNWLKYRFKTGRVILPGLEVAVDLAPNQYFRHDGVVDDLEEHVKTLKDALGVEYIRPQEEGVLGYCYFFNYCTQDNSENGQLVVTVSKRTTPMGALFNIGHESTHALYHFGQERKLVETLREYGFKLNPYERYTDKEDICNIGGLFAVYLVGELKNISLERSSKKVIYLLNDLLESGDYRR